MQQQIFVADQTLAFRPVAIDDITPTGAQLAAAAGFRPDEQPSVLHMLTSGELEDIRPNEVVDLRRDSDRFIIVASDRALRFTVDGTRFDWPVSVVSGALVRRLGNVAPGHALYLERVGKPDRVIELSDLVNLNHDGVESFISRETALHLKITYNGQQKTLEISREATVKILLQRSIELFGSLPNPHTLALWTAQGVELTNENQTLKDAHVKDGDCLILRPSAVKGG